VVRPPRRLRTRFIASAMPRLVLPRLVAGNAQKWGETKPDMLGPLPSPNQESCDRICHVPNPHDVPIRTLCGSPRSDRKPAVLIAAVPRFCSRSRSMARPLRQSRRGMSENQRNHPQSAADHGPRSRALDARRVSVALVLGWVFGPAGMLLSVPLTMIVKILLESGANTLDRRVARAGSCRRIWTRPPGRMRFRRPSARRAGNPRWLVGRRELVTARHLPNPTPGRGASPPGDRQQQ
jgi:hypothetical protein